ILLAFEVVWLRFLTLSVFSTTLALSLMLAVILTGIGLGGLGAGGALQRWPAAAQAAPGVALAAGALGLADSPLFPAGGGVPCEDWRAAVALATLLMLPVSLLSGVLFTVLGTAIKETAGGETRSVGLLTLANTTGAMLGALAGGFVLLPLVGIEKSLLA